MTDTRSEYTRGLRALADLLDAHPDVPLPGQGGLGRAPMTIYCADPAGIERFAKLLLPGGMEITATPGYTACIGRMYGLRVEAFARPLPARLAAS